MRYLLIILATLTFSGCSTRPVFTTNDRYDPLPAQSNVAVLISPDQPAPDGKRFAFTIRQIGVGSQSDLNSAINQGIRNARSIGSTKIFVVISEPDTRRQKVEISYFR